MRHRSTSRRTWAEGLPGNQRKKTRPACERCAKVAWHERACHAIESNSPTMDSVAAPKSLCVPCKEEVAPDRRTRPDQAGGRRHLPRTAVRRMCLVRLTIRHRHSVTSVCGSWCEYVVETWIVIPSLCEGVSSSMRFTDPHPTKAPQIGGGCPARRSRCRVAHLHCNEVFKAWRIPNVIAQLTAMLIFTASERLAS